MRRHVVCIAPDLLDAQCQPGRQCYAIGRVCNGVAAHHVGSNGAQINVGPVSEQCVNDHANRRPEAMLTQAPGGGQQGLARGNNVIDQHWRQTRVPGKPGRNDFDFAVTQPPFVEHDGWSPATTCDVFHPLTTLRVRPDDQWRSDRPADPFRNGRCGMDCHGRNGKDF